MYIKFDVYDFEDLSKIYKPWGGAKYNYDLLCKSDTWEEFLCCLEEFEPEGITETELNDVLWFEDALVYGFVNDEYLSEEELEIKRGC